MNKNFVTIVWHRFRNVDLINNVGQIPSYMNKIYGYDAYIVTHKDEKNYSFLKYAKGVKLRYIKKSGKIFFLKKSVLKYLIKNSKKINILNIWFFNKESFVYGIIYKILNPKGIFYLRLDVDNNEWKEKYSYKNAKSIFKRFYLKIFNLIGRLVLKKIDIISAETKEGVELMKKEYGKNTHKKVIQVVNGVDDKYIKKNIKIKKFSEKENIILNVGRIGTYQKNTEMLLKALEKINLKNWKVYIVGPITFSFEKYKNDFLKKNPKLKEKIKFFGAINDRKKLFELYNKSKIFCLTSRAESGPHVLSEASYFGNYIVTTNTNSSKELTNNEKIGSIVSNNNFSELGKVLQKIINNPKLISLKYDKIIKYSKKFELSEAVKLLENKIKEISN